MNATGNLSVGKDRKAERKRKAPQADDVGKSARGTTKKASKKKTDKKSDKKSDKLSKKSVKKVAAVGANSSTDPEADGSKQCESGLRSPPLKSHSILPTEQDPMYDFPMSQAAKYIPQFGRKTVASQNARSAKIPSIPTPCDAVNVEKATVMEQTENEAGGGASSHDGQATATSQEDVSDGVRLRDDESSLNVLLQQSLSATDLGQLDRTSKELIEEVVKLDERAVEGVDVTVEVVVEGNEMPGGEAGIGGSELEDVAERDQSNLPVQQGERSAGEKLDEFEKELIREIREDVDRELEAETEMETEKEMRVEMTTVEKIKMDEEQDNEAEMVAKVRTEILEEKVTSEEDIKERHADQINSNEAATSADNIGSDTMKTGKFEILIPVPLDENFAKLCENDTDRTIDSSRGDCVDVTTAVKSDGNGNANDRDATQVLDKCAVELQSALDDCDELTDSQLCQFDDEMLAPDKGALPTVKAKAAGHLEASQGSTLLRQVINELTAVNQMLVRYRREMEQTKMKVQNCRGQLRPQFYGML